MGEMDSSNPAAGPGLRSRPSSSTSPLSTPCSLSSSIPFSWESQPGIPKAGPSKPTSPNLTLPLPPPLRSTKQPHTHRRHPQKKSNAADPFTVALMECSKDADDDLTPPKRWVDRRRRTFRLMTIFHLYASCKSTSSVADASIYVRRARPAYGILPPRPE